MGIIKEIAKDIAKDVVKAEIVQPVFKVIGDGAGKASEKLHDAMNDTHHVKENKFASKVKSMQEKDDDGIYLFLKKKAFTWTDKYEVFDADKKILYYVKGEALSAKRHLKVYNANNELLATARESLVALRSPISKEKLLSNRKPFDCKLEILGQEPVVMKSTFGLYQRVYYIKDLGLQIEGNLFGGSLRVFDEDNNTILRMPKRNPYRDYYAIRISDKQHELLGLLITLAVNVDFEDTKLNQLGRAISHSESELEYQIKRKLY